jgi:hypothetical protein
MAACSSRCPGLRHHLFTTVPHEFFGQSLGEAAWEIHRVECDVGMIQLDPFAEDVEATADALERLPLEGGAELDTIVAETAATGAPLVVSDIAPLGLLVADRLGLAGVLVENFTWDWIYQAYRSRSLDAVGRRMTDIFDSAALRIQTIPVCRPKTGARTVAPISRRRRQTSSEVRGALGIPKGRRVVLLSVSGLSSEVLSRRGFRAPSGTVLLAPGRTRAPVREEGLIRLPFVGGPFHPDLVAASDVVVGKLGYSTIAEVYHARTALAFSPRPRFPESQVLETFVRDSIPCARLPPGWLEDPATTEILEDLLETPRPKGPRPNGAGEAAELILGFLDGLG